MKITEESFLKELPQSYAEIFQKGLIRNYTLECAEKFKFSRTITIVDTTLRDGEQQPGIFFTPEQKVEIAKLLAEVKIDAAEIGYPAVSEDEMRACKMIADEKLRMPTFVMARAKKEDIDAAIKADARMVDLFTSLSEFHIRYKLKITPEENISMFLDAVDYARDHGLLVAFGNEDSSRAELEYLVKFFTAYQKAGGFGASLSDTTGSFTPCSARWLVTQLKSRLPRFRLAMHCHNDFGMATANTLAGLEAGAEGFSGTILGIGERAGNAPLEEVILALRTLYGIKLRVKTEKLLEVGRLVAKYAGIPIHVSKPILGANCFKHESGIHAAGVLAHPLIYEPIPAEWISRKSSYVFGKFSGTTVLLKAALEPYGIHPEKEKLAEILQQIKLKQSRRRGKELERFVEEYERRMEEMALSVEEVIEIAKQVIV